MNTRMTFENLLDEIKVKLSRNLEVQEVEFINWMHEQHHGESQLEGAGSV